MRLTEAATLDRKSGEADLSRLPRRAVEGSAVSLDRTPTPRRSQEFNARTFQVMLISAALSAGRKQVVWSPAGVSVPGLAGANVPSLFIVAP